MRAYAEYAQAAKKVFHLALRLGVARGLPHDPTEPLEPDQHALELLSNAEGERGQDMGTGLADGRSPDGRGGARLAPSDLAFDWLCTGEAGRS